MRLTRRRYWASELYTGFLGKITRAPDAVGKHLGTFTSYKELAY
jgi:hypothetical protein